MTLVIAQKKGAIISAVSDTGVTENGLPLPPERGLPKIAIHSPDLAVGFAGNPELALEAIAALSRGASPPAVVGHFRDFHRAKEQVVDFILMLRRPTLRLVKIANGEVGTGLGLTAWIGDHDAFAEFQRYRNDRRSRRVAHEIPLLLTHKQSESNPDNATVDMIGSMRRILLDRRLPHVFGHAVGVNNVDGGFEYRPYAFVLDERRSSLLLPDAFLHRLEPESRELRDYSASCFVTTATSPRSAVAFHFMRGKITYIYHGDRGAPLAHYTLARAMNVDEFMEMMRAKGCTDWTGQVVTRTPPTPDYGIAPHRWQQRS
jgi:hypothetical protein